MNDVDLIELKNLLINIVGESQIHTNKAMLSQYGTDWTKQFSPAPLIVVLPKTVKQVQALVLLANQKNIKIVPSGGRTGLSAGAVAANGEMVISLAAMNRIKTFNETDRSVVCEAGVITAQLQQFSDEKNLFYPVDFASSGSSQIGGNIATNAGGIKVLRYGLTRDWVAGLKVVTGKGEILNLNNGLVKNATGYDLRHLFIGAEGTLGIIVEATMRLTRKPGRQHVLVLGVPQFDEIMKVLQTFQSHIDLTAFEFFSDEALQHVLAAGKLTKPFDTPARYYALIEFEEIAETTLDKVLKLFEYCMEQSWVLDGVISQSEAQAKSLWQLRENISETISHFTPYKNDLSVNVSDVPTFLTEVETVVSQRYPTFEIIWFGHIGDGNVHLNILKPTDLEKDLFFQQCEAVNDEIFQIVKKFGGSISAEHGVGLLKKPYLHYSRSPEEITAMQALKAVFDPENIMNPGKLL